MQPDQCDHGKRIPRAGKSAKTGRYWAGWICPDRVCDPKWVTAHDVYNHWAQSNGNPDAKVFGSETAHEEDERLPAGPAGSANALPRTEPPF